MSQTWTPDPRALFTRVVDDIVAQIRDGRLRPGDRVLSTRELADFYGVATMTAVRAQRELQVRGATYGMVGKGTFVRPDALARLATAANVAGCTRCQDESAYAKRLVDAIDRCHRLADQIEAHPWGEAREVASEVRRLASILAGEPLDRADHLDRCDDHHHHCDYDDDEDDGWDDDWYD